MRRLLGALLVTTTLPLLAGCGEERPDPVAEATDSASAPATEPTRTTASAGVEDVPPGWDERPDGPSPTPDSALDDAALTGLLRTRASVRAQARHCRPEQVRVTLEGYDQAAGHRFTRIVVRNTSARACVVEGIPGIGVRGAWGRTFVPAVTAGDGVMGGVTSTVVELAPAAQATADLEWSGELGGAESEPASLLVVQLAAGQVPVAVPARIGASTEPLDIGMFTTLDVSPFEPGS